MEDGQLSCCLSGRSLQGTLHHHAAREGPGPGEVTSEIHQDHEGNCGSVPRALQLCLGRLEPSALCCPYPYHCLSAAPAQAEQLQLLPGHPLSSGLSTHPQAGVAEANLRGGWWKSGQTGMGLIRMDMGLHLATHLCVTKTAASSKTSASFLWPPVSRSCDFHDWLWVNSPSFSC